MIVVTDDHLQMADPSRLSFARGWSLQVIICKRLAPPDDNLQEAGPSNDHLQNPTTTTTTSRTKKGNREYLNLNN